MRTQICTNGCDFCIVVVCCGGMQVQDVSECVDFDKELKT